jgi:uncharacterized protein (UPF0332 family)
MTSAEDKAPDAPVKPKRILPRGGKWPAAVAEARRREATPPVRQASQAERQPKERRVNPAGALWAKAEAAGRSGRALLQAGDWDGAANRAYYAAFSAARAVLARFRASLADSKGHSTIVRRFEKHLVSERGFDPALGRHFFGRLSHVRWVADYGEARLDEAAARAAIGDAERFLAVAGPYMKKAKP